MNDVARRADRAAERTARESDAISRRTLLRGLGTAVALPWLESLAPRRAWCAESERPALRTGFFFFPNGAYTKNWRPAETGRGYELSPILEPLVPVREKVLVISGLALDAARPHGEGPGDHARGVAAFLTAARPRKTVGAKLWVGTSVDQVAAGRIGRATRFPSLELGVEGSAGGGNCDAGYSCAYVSNISWRAPNAPAPKETSPVALFDRLFAGGGVPEREAVRSKRMERRQSVLDFVLDDAQRLKGRVSASDNRKIDEYFDSVREVERRLQLRSQVAPPTLKRPETDYLFDFRQHVEDMFDLIALAFQTDQTRILSFSYGNAATNRPYPELGVTEGHHLVSHHRLRPQLTALYTRINRLHVEYFTRLLRKLDSIQEADTTLLDNCLLLYGSAIGDGNLHNHDQLPILLAGQGCGTVDSGRHVALASETPLANLYVSLLDRLGDPSGKFADSTGPLSQIDAS